MSLWFCGLFDLAPKTLQNCKQWAPFKNLSHAVTSVDVMLIGAAPHSATFEFSLLALILQMLLAIAR